MSTVCAFVLTRDRPRMLGECVRALLAQTRPLDSVVVLDNASREDAEASLRAAGLLDDGRVAAHHSAVNLGSSGGYARGLELALATGADWIWLMDDDAEPTPDALEAMLRSPASSDPGTVGLCGTVLTPGGEVETVHRCRMRRLIVPIAAEEYAAGPVVDCCSFVGLLVTSAAVRAAGLPRPELFIAYDDAEWTLRLREHGAIRLVPGSRVSHKNSMGGRATTGRSRVWNRLLGTQYASAPWSGYWKTLYGVRNFMSIKHRHGPLPLPAFAGLTALYAAKAALFDERPLRAVPLVVRYAWKGRCGDFGGPAPAEWTPGPAPGAAATFDPAPHG